jgi:hypothetical protein
MVSEDFVSYSIMRYLQSKNWKIIHYHPPGGQPSMSIQLDEGRFVPDIIAIKNLQVLVAENKPIFSKSDINKLELIFSDPSLIHQISTFILKKESNIKKNQISELNYFWVHGYGGQSKGVSHPIINFLNVEPNGNIKILLSEKKSLVFE